MKKSHFFYKKLKKYKIIYTKWMLKNINKIHFFLIFRPCGNGRFLLKKVENQKHSFTIWDGQNGLNFVYGKWTHFIVF